MDFRLDVIIEDGSVFWSCIWQISREEARVMFGDVPPKLDHKSSIQPVLSGATGEVFIQLTRVL